MIRQLSRVVWSEGMYLGPHDFQAESAWFENSIEFGVQALCFKPYGYVACTFNDDALANGSLSLVHARGIFPDGLPFLIDECDPIPPARAVRELFAPTANRLLLSLAVPAFKPGQQNVAPQGSTNSSMRYTAAEQKFVDENTGTDEKNVTVQRKNIRILAETEPAEGMTLLPLARIRRSPDGKFVRDEQFIPPCIRISASTTLLGLTERLIEVLAEKGESRRPIGAAARTFSAGLSSHEVAAFWFRHALNSAIPILRHLCFSQRGHPEELYRELLRLAGALCTFGLQSNAAELPLYDHHDLGACFTALDKHIREHLEMLAPSNCIVIPLLQSSDYLYKGEIKDARCFGRSRWLLSVRSRMEEAALITEVPRLVKVCSARFVPELVRRAVPGMPLLHVPVPPSAVTPRVDAQYFSLSREGPCWEDMMQTRQVGVYVPGKIPEPELELLVLVEGSR